MTKADAYREEHELRYREDSWPIPLPHRTPYMAAVMRRCCALFNYWRNDGPMPCERGDWECPPRDVEETVENFWRRDTRHAMDPEAAFRRHWEKYGGKYPPIPEWTEELERNFGGRGRT